MLRIVLATALTTSVGLCQQALFSTDQGRDAAPILPARGEVLDSGDLDGDGRAEIVTASSIFSSTINVYSRAPGTEDWSETTTSLPFQNGRPIPAALRLADIDGDQDLDVIVGLSLAFSQTGWSSIATYRNDGTGNLTFYRDEPLLNNHLITGLAVGDLDADGDVDVLVGSSPTAPSNDSLVLFRNVGNGGLNRESTSVPSIQADGTRPYLIDWDGDGDLDALVGRQQDTTLLLLNNAGSFSVALTPLPQGAASWQGATVADLDGDGDDDAAAVLDDGTTQILINQATPVLTALGGPSAIAIHTGDFNGDGTTDLMTRDESSITEWVRQGGAFSPTVRLERSGSCTAFGVADLNGDSFADSISLWGRSPTGFLMHGSPSGLFADPRVQIGPNFSSTAGGAVTIADMDQNGLLDVVTVDSGSGSINRPILIEFNRGEGRFEQVLTPRQSNSVTRELFAFDIDGDQDLDLLEQSSTSLNYLLVVHRNDGASFARQPPLSVPSAVVAAADLNGDGRTDLVCGGTVGGVPSLGVHMGDGTGGFLPAVPLPVAASPTPKAIALLDIDGDQDLDILLLREAAQCTDALLNNGGTFVATGTCAFAVGPSSSISRFDTGDINGDGLDDLVLVINGQLRVGINAGDNTFTNTTAASLGGWNPPSGIIGDVHLFDADNDGDVDLCVAANSGQRFLFNLDGTFQDVTNGTWDQGPLSTNPIASGDLDGDGDPEIVIFGTVFWSHLRHLTPTSAPRVGGSLDLRASLDPGFTLPGSAWLLWVGFDGLAPQTVPGLLGELQFDPTGAYTAGFFPAPATVGTTDISIPIPNSPNFVGTELHAQAIAISGYWGAGFTNSVFQRVLW